MQRNAAHQDPERIDNHPDHMRPFTLLTRLYPPRLALALTLTLCIGPFAQAQQWVPLGPDDGNWPSQGGTSYSSLKLDGTDNPVVAYQDDATGGKATVMRWNGSSWNAVGNPGFSAGVANFLSLALDASGNPVVAYSDNANLDRTTVMRWNGSSWSVVGGYGISAGPAVYQSLVLDASGNPVVAYMDVASGNKTTVMRWDGSSWSAVGGPGISVGTAQFNSLALDTSGNPVVAYLDQPTGNKTTVMRWNGSSWSAVGGIGISAGWSQYQSLALDASGNPVVAYEDVANGSMATVMRWDGSSWSTVGSSGFSAASALFTSLALDASGNPVVSYSDGANGNLTTVMRWNGSSWSTVGGPGISVGVTQFNSLALDASGNPVVAYQDAANGNKATVMRWNGSSWSAVGSPGFSAGSAPEQSLALDASGDPVVAYRDDANGFKSTVMRWDGSSWSPVGSPGFSTGGPLYLSLALDTSGDPVVAYEDLANGGMATVMRWDGSSWSTVGSPGFSGADAPFTSLALDASGNPVVSYSDGANGYLTTVMRWDGSSWSAVGSPGFSAGAATYQSLALDASGNPVVAYSDGANGYMTTVMRWDGSSWSTVGSPGFSAGMAISNSLALDASGNPVVAYQDVANGNKTTVMRWDGSSWSAVGSSGISAGVAWSPSLALDPSGNPVVAYRDGANGQRTTVMRWDGTSWITMGTAGFTGVNTSNSTRWLQVDAHGRLVVAYASGYMYAKRYGHTITTDAIAGSPFCAGASVSVPFTTFGTFSLGNTFTAELSDASGSFASPVVIGSLVSNVSGTIACIIPPGTPGGTGYRIRVVSSNPAVTGTDNGSGLTINAPSLWYADSDGDGYGDPAVSVLACAQPVAHVSNFGDCNDTDVNLTVIGLPCDDGSASTENDVVTSLCTCEGTPLGGPCTENEVTLDLSTDAASTETTWDIVLDGTNVVVCNGGGYGPNGSFTASCCLPDGCYDLRVFDSGGDGIDPGGFTLRDANGDRILDNAGNGAYFGSQSEAPFSFCVPIGTTSFDPSSCDVLNATPNTVLHVTPIPAVTSVYGPGTPWANANTGYHYWIFNPHGGYNRRITLTHAVPGSGYPPSTPVALRCSYLKLTQIQSFPVPLNVPLNIRVRTLINGVYGEFGPACKLFLPTPACPVSQLTTAADPVVSCGATGLSLGGIIWADQVTSATDYQFEFSRPSYLRRITSSTRSQALNFYTYPLMDNTCYNVRVRVSFDGGTTFCPFGPYCTITLGTAICGFGAMPPMVEDDNFTDLVVMDEQLTLWPNPSDGSRINLALTGSALSAGTVQVELTDGCGKLVITEVLPAHDGQFRTSLDLDRALAPGLYLVKVRAGDQMHTRRLVIQ